ncbi:MAG: stage III sporulation protein AB [Lawsonibacter sp.]|jgi:stage III sporulation protein AB
MVKLVGAILVAIGCGWMGFQACAALSVRVRTLETIDQGLALLEQELELDNPPLSVLMERLVARSGEPARSLFYNCLQALEHLAEEDFSSAWRRLVVEIQSLGEEGAACLASLGDTLGRCSSLEQRQAVDVVRCRLQDLERQAREERRRQGKVYQALGLSGGAFLILLLI